jgi:tRNA 2-selenouridine synthase
MTSRQDSSKPVSTRPSSTDVESLAGLFHPHAIEIQEFSYYALILDVRSSVEFDDDHIPGAMRLAPGGLRAAAERDDPAAVVPTRDGADSLLVPSALASLVASVRLDQAILVYCGRGGRDSLPVAKALRWRGWTVDVLPGGWANYRRWVQAGLEALPRRVDFRVVRTALGSEAARVLAGLGCAGQQVLDVASSAGWRAGALTPMATQPTQAIFESRLLHALRQFDPSRPVWVADTERQLGRVILPGALMDALAGAPTAALACPLAERLACWRDDEPVLKGSVEAVVEAVATASPTPEPQLIAACRGQTDGNQLLARVLVDRDERARMRQGARAGNPSQMPALITNTLAADGLLEAIRAWLPQAVPAERG